jgi:hypothetical protein
MENQDVRITAFRINNYLRIKDAVLTKAGDMNWVTGGNNTGKTTVLKAIKELFVSSGVEPELIHEDAETGEIFVELNGHIKATRSLTATSNVVKVVDGDMPIEKPKAYLMSLLGGANLEFDPTVFFLAKGKAGRRERYEMILKGVEFVLDKEALLKTIAGEDGEVSLIDIEKFDFTKHGLKVMDGVKKDIYDRRTEKGRDVGQLKKSIAQDMTEIPDTFDTEKFQGFDVNKRLEDLTIAKDVESGHRADVERLDYYRSQKDDLNNSITNKQNRIEQLLREADVLKEEINQVESDKDALIVKGVALKKNIEGYVSPGTVAIQDEIAEYNDSQKLLLKLEAIADREKTLAFEQERHTALDNLYDVLVNRVSKAIMQQIKMPIKGLTLKDDKIYQNGINIERLSDSKQIAFAISMARVMAGKFKAIMADRLEAFDDDNRKAFNKECAGDGYQYWCTQVTNGPLQIETDGKSRNVTAKPKRKKATRRTTLRG